MGLLKIEGGLVPNGQNHLGVICVVCYTYIEVMSNVYMQYTVAYRVYTISSINISKGTFLPRYI